MKLKHPDNDSLVVEASTWAKAVLPTFLKLHEKCAAPLTKEVLEHIVEEALASGYMTGSAVTMESVLPTDENETVH